MAKYKPKTILTPRQGLFVQQFLKHGELSRAAREAGCSTKQASSKAWRFMQRGAVKSAIEDARRIIVEKSAYNLEAAMREADEAIAFAIKTGNANAYVKAAELKAKLNGLLVDKMQIQLPAFSLRIGGIDDPPPAIDVASQVIASLPAPQDDDEEDDTQTTEEELLS